MPIEASLSEERERMHRAMLSSVSHDLKTPLASIIGSLEIYERMHERLSEEKKQMLIRTALSESYRLDNFITNILDMAKLENNMVSLRKEPLSLSSFLGDIITNLGPRIDKNRVVLPQHIPAVKLHTDTTLLARAVSIVLDNAAKHGAYPITINYALNKERQEFQIIVADEGEGVPKGKEKDIFAKYTRYAKGDHQNAGTGLGLPIATEIMRILGGSLVALPSSIGAQFVFSLPQES